MEKKELPINLDQLTKFLEEYLVEKVPALPKNVKEFLVKYAYLLNIIGIVLTIPAILSILGIGAMFTVYTAGFGLAAFGLMSWLALAFMAVGLGLRVLALPGLKARTIKGWEYTYYAALLNAVYSLINFDLGGLIIGTAISLYFIFQVKSYYQK